VDHIRVYEIALRLQAREEPIHEALGNHLMLAAIALRDIERVDEGKAVAGSEIPAIEKVLGGCS